MSSPLPSAGLRARIAALTPRERRFLAAAGLALLLFTVYLLWPGGDEANVELAEAPTAVPAPAVPAPTAPSVMPPLPAAPSPSVMPPLPAIPAPSRADPGAVAGLTLRGVMGGGASGGAAIVSGADGAQRVVRVGRELAPGLILRQIGVNYAIASSGGGDIRLELNKAGGIAVAAASAARPPAMGTTALPGPAAARRETTSFRLGLQPMKSNGRTSGYTIKAGAVPERLQRAGLRPGDLILRVNGSELDEERLTELSWEMSNAERTEFEFIRNGKRMKAALQ